MFKLISAVILCLCPQKRRMQAWLKTFLHKAHVQNCKVIVSMPPQVCLEP